MFGKIKKLARGSKGFEALQAVLLIGGAFVVVWGLMSVWGSAEKPLSDELNRVVVGGNKQ